MVSLPRRLLPARRNTQPTAGLFAANLAMMQLIRANTNNIQQDSLLVSLGNITECSYVLLVSLTNTSQLSLSCLPSVSLLSPLETSTSRLATATATGLWPQLAVKDPVQKDMSTSSDTSPQRPNIRSCYLGSMLLQLLYLMCVIYIYIYVYYK